MSTKMTIEQIALVARQRADQVNSQFVTDAELEGYINQSYFELYDILIQKYGENYFARSGTFTTDGSSSFYSFVPDIPNRFYSGTVYDRIDEVEFYKLLGVDLKLTPQSGQESWVTVRPFQFADRNRYAVPNMQSFYGLTNLRYRIHNNGLWLTPTPAAGQTLRYWYVPRMTQMVSVATCTFYQGANWPLGEDSIYVQWDGASGTVLFDGAMQTPFVNNTGSNAINIPVLAEELTYITMPYVNGYASCSYDVNNFDQYVSGNSDGYLYLHSNLSTGIRWDIDSNERVSLSPQRNVTWSGVMDGISGWTEYVIIDAAIKMMQKEESDVSVLMAQKQAIIARIEAAAANRDAGNPATVSDSQWSDYWLPMGQGGTYGGGGIF